MKKIKNIRILNHFIIILFASFYLVDILLNFKISQDFSLIPSKALELNEIFRVITYPLSFFTIESAILFLFTILLLFPFYEIKFRVPVIISLLFGIVLIQGLIFTSFFHNSDIVLKGTDGISFFLITFFILNNFNLKLLKINPKLFHINAFILLISMSWIVTVYLHSKFADFDLLTPSAFSMIFGISSGLILDIGIKFYKLFLGIMNPPKPRIPEVSDEEFMLAEISKNEKKYQNGQSEKSRFNEFDSDYFSEDRLNQILDKINSEGKKSLTKEELNYLEEYSKRI